ncbi:biotin synthase BioB [[Clostridium] dakarense]|uniref:biotin synthase BioB n=1 Tax=Faecalimicrobium dakarense TaxID=1301100 RepID=UPI0004BAC2B8|nr:biotin synthase BioB [[Clostridium] dakarense]
MIKKIVEDIKNGYIINKDEAMELLKYDLGILAKYANEIRTHFLGNKFDLCCIVNGKSGKCSEDCKFCAQSAYHETNIDVYPLLTKEEFIKDAKYNHDKEVKRYSIVTSGKRLSKNEVDVVCKSYEAIKNEVGIRTCASHGLLDEEDMIKLKNVGVERYHNNLETSRSHFKKICSTHTYDEKIETIKSAQKAGIEVCSGGIIGLGESEEDRIDMAFDLRELNIKSIPLNMLNFVEGTKIGDAKKVSEEEFLKTVAIFRFINPDSQIRLAGGRNLLTENGKKAFEGGANATITGDMLTTCGSGITEDVKMIRNLGFEI